MLFDHPDAAVRAYSRLIERASSPSRSVVSHGREYEQRCTASPCKRARARLTGEAKTANRRRRIVLAAMEAEGLMAEAYELLNQPPQGVADWVEFYSTQSESIEQRCAFCMKERTWVDSYILGGGGGGRRGMPPGGMVRAGDLAPVSAEIEALADEPGLGPTAAEVYVRCVTFGRSYDLTASDCTELAVGGRRWTADQVAQIVRRARARLRRRLEARGLMVGRREVRGWKRGGVAR